MRGTRNPSLKDMNYLAAETWDPDEKMVEKVWNIIERNYVSSSEEVTCTLGLLYNSFLLSLIGVNNMLVMAGALSATRLETEAQGNCGVVPQVGPPLDSNGEGNAFNGYEKVLDPTI